MSLTACALELTPPPVIAQLELDREQIAGGFKRRFDFAAGSTYLAVVEQHAADVELVLSLPDGTELHRNNLTFDHVRAVESMVFTPDTDGPLIFELEPDLVARGARVDFRLSELPDRTESDRRRIAAEKALSDAQRVNGWSKESVAPLVEATRTFGELGLPEREAAAAYVEASVAYSQLYDWRLSAERAADAARLWGQLGDELKWAAAMLLGGMARMESAEDDPESRIRLSLHSAQRRLCQAASVQLGQGAKVDLALTANNVGYGLHKERLLDQAERRYQEAFDRAMEAEVKPLALIGLQNLAKIYEDRGEYHRAAETYTTILTRESEDLSTPLEGQVWEKLGDVRIKLEQWDLAIDAHERALPIRSDASDEARRLAKMSYAYLALGNPERARIYLEQAEAKSTGTDEGSTLEAIQSARLQMMLAGDSAASALNGLARLAADATSPARRARIAALQTELLLELDRPEEALEVAREGLAESRAQDQQSLIVGSLIQVARAALAQSESRVDEAVAALHEAEAFVRDQGSARLKSDFEATVALLRRRQGDWPGALERSEQALKELWQGQHEIASLELQSGFLQTQQRLAGLHVDLLLEAAAETAEPVRARELERTALAWEDSMRAATLRQHRLRRATLQASANADARKRLGEVEDELRRHAQNDGAAMKIENLMRQRDRLHAKLSGIELSLPGPGRTPLDRVQRNLPDDTVVLYYRPRRRESQVWVITNEEVVMVALAGAGEIASAVATLADEMKLLVAGRGEQSARAVARLILDPVVDRLHAERIVLVIGGVLQRVPFAALPLPSGGVLGDFHTLEVAPNLAAAVAITPAGYGLDALVLGAPSGSDLPGSKKESIEIKALFPGDRVVLLTGFDATPENLLAHQERRPRFLHIAAHAEANLEYPQLSVLRLARYDRNGEDLGDASRVTGFDIARQRFDSELIVLSACQTAVGKNFDLQGIGGLPLEFIASGAGAVLASLWRVPDEATGKLMTSFYKELVNNQADPARALKRAQAEVKRESRWQDPFYWAGWTLYESSITNP